jgi:hypothetical protein
MADQFESDTDVPEETEYDLAVHGLSAVQFWRIG